uniref:Ferritin-like diiron domain-containing protein n=1 Tax=Rhodosorus marinus TaxID=101924 RepID=A0A7S0BRR0_9RHOD|mmetsp:Transcript_6268/g.8886  ORF Transcript_6268/g.8886 Transcript_6268/m.8886 type:complete len:208 (+) Transcript_6268:50-673(+)
MSLVRGSSSLRRFSVQKWQSLSTASFSRPMSSKVTMDDEHDEHDEELVPLAGTKTYENLREAFAKKAMAMARYEYYAQKADVEGLTHAAQVLRGISNSAKEQAFGHMEFLDEGDEEETEASSTDMNIESCLAHERKEFEEKYPTWAEVAYEENLSDVGTWMETLRNTSFNNMRTLQKLQDAVEELYKEAEEEDAMSRGQNGRTNEGN